MRRDLVYVKIYEKRLSIKIYEKSKSCMCTRVSYACRAMTPSKLIGSRPLSFFTAPYICVRRSSNVANEEWKFVQAKSKQAVNDRNGRG